ncbi:2-amino-4-hydroxy-6-hydroxymethyldihydropteridine diphosphokinase [Coraliomargarita parva]|uniref:2-amino-4-hydroxy-6- hydroxymethyldihydropteridine diphosphokinase n=1 Tax=Coraliomargarita parva TaxID=3014050 RepID=UPI0022B4EF27|nr:2-amino-4-hydroxy-6-hydroxymethyldihydropteridine diphosphokinase [Coraliomargarita parva]
MPLSKAYLALGSNLGDRLAQMREALRLLEARGSILISRVSRIYENRAVGMGEADPFLNAVAEVRTSLDPEALLDACLETENRLGRVRTGVWAPRTIDLDVLAYGETERDTERLQLPHPRIEQRDFVLQPIVDVDPALVIRGRTAAAWLENLNEVDLTVRDLHLWPFASVNMIAAVARNRVIGINGDLPWDLPEDWDIFLKKTLGGTLVMGRISFLGMLREPSWREDRCYVVVTSQPEAVAEYGVRTAASVEDALHIARDDGRPVWICGGEQIYREAIPLSGKFHLTSIGMDVVGDTYFPDYACDFKRTEAEVESGDDNLHYRFTVLGR